MKKPVDVAYDWSVDKMLEISIEKPDDNFLKIRETLTRMGILSKRQREDGKNELVQSVHILHKKGKYYLVHFKELFLLDGREANLTVGDIERRNLIASLIQEWRLAKIVNPNLINIRAPMSSIRVIPYNEKGNYHLVAKYTIGGKKK